MMDNRILPLLGNLCLALQCTHRPVEWASETTKLCISSSSWGGSASWIWKWNHQINNEFYPRSSNINNQLRKEHSDFHLVLTPTPQATEHPDQSLHCDMAHIESDGGSSSSSSGRFLQENKPSSARYKLQEIHFEPKIGTYLQGTEP